MKDLQLDIIKKWVAFYFTDDEDLFLVAENGLIVFLDPKTGNIKENKDPFILHNRFSINKLVDSRFDQPSNMLVLRDQACQFFWIKNVQNSSRDSPHVNKFQSS